MLARVVWIEDRCPSEKQPPHSAAVSGKHYTPRSHYDRDCRKQQQQSLLLRDASWQETTTLFSDTSRAKEHAPDPRSASSQRNWQRSCGTYDRLIDAPAIRQVLHRRKRAKLVHDVKRSSWFVQRFHDHHQKTAITSQMRKCREHVRQIRPISVAVAKVWLKVVCFCALHHASPFSHRALFWQAQKSHLHMPNLHIKVSDASNGKPDW